VNVADTPFVGEAFSLGAAALWALAVTLFHPAIEVHGARAVNFLKCALAATLQSLTVCILGQASGWLDLTWTSFGWIAASGVIGLVLGDTALFTSVRTIGVHRTLLMQTTSPLFSALIAWFTIGEVPTSRQSIGGAVILAGIALVVSPRGGVRWAVPTAGLAAAVIAAVSQAGGIVLAKAGMQTVPVLPASALRLAVAAIGMGLLAALGRRRGEIGVALRGPLLFRRVVPATFAGTYLAMFLFMGGIAFAPAAIASVLVGTVPIFSLLLDSVHRRRLPDTRSILGTLFAVAGVALLALG
jgi:drug/metabolite transporter (DMT)-like permease